MAGHGVDQPDLGGVGRKVGGQRVDLLIPVAQYRKILLGTLDCILERFQTRDTGGFIDTKIDIRTGRNLSHTVEEVDLFGAETVYGWIQGRGLEAL